MLLLMIEKDIPIDCVLYAETGMDFPEMTEHIAKLDDLLYRERGIHITTLRHPKGFEWLMFDVPQQQKRAIERRIALGQPLKGYGWPGMRVRWCTGQLKTHLIEKEVNRLKQEKNALHHIGIAADEAPPKPRHCRFATTGALILVACTTFTAALPAGVAPFNGLMSCGNCAPTTRSCGRGCGIWTTGQGRSSVPDRWGSSSKIGVWSGWRNDLRKRK